MCEFVNKQVFELPMYLRMYIPTFSYIMTDGLGVGKYAKKLISVHFVVVDNVTTSLASDISFNDKAEK